jgi:prepilin-type processing-associated H-X9-DG protein
MFMHRLKIKRKQITDGVSKTIAIGEVVDEDTDNGFNIWSYAFRTGTSMHNTYHAINTPPGFPYTPANALSAQVDCKYGPCWNGAYGSSHPGGAIFVFADGHVTYISENIAAEIYRGASTIANGEILPDIN